MLKSLHGKSIFKTNLATSIKIAEETGFNSMEIVASSLKDYLAYYTVKDLQALLKKHGVKPVCINDIAHVETIIPEKHANMIEETFFLCRVAEEINCPTIQLVPLCEHQGKSLKEAIRLTAENVREISEIGMSHGVRFQLEPVAWSPIHSLKSSLQLIAASEATNVGMVIDFWHLYAGRETSCDEVAALDARMIYNVHFCDGKRSNQPIDETILRGFYPGEGDIDIFAWVDAVKATGYNGAWSCELVSAKHWEADVLEVAKRLSAEMDRCIFN